MTAATTPTVLDLISLFEKPTPDEDRTARVLAAGAKLRGRELPDPPLAVVLACAAGPVHHRRRPMSFTEDSTTAAMLSQLLADFEDGLAIGRFEHALGRLHTREHVARVPDSSDSELRAEKALTGEQP